MTTDHSTIFESFNARALKPSQVAKTFVPSEHYRMLAKRQHSLIVGPRGSGKTTLLKMLQQPALQQWQHPSADELRSHVDFTGIFVATDISWKEQLDALKARFADPETGEVIVRAAITSHVLRAVVLAILHRTALHEGAPAREFRRVAISPEQEASVAEQIAGSWYLRPRIPSFLAIKQALTTRLVALSTMFSRAKRVGTELRSQIADSPEYHLAFLPAAAVAVEAFDDAINEEGRWGFLFDELELAPDWLRDELVQSLRSRDDRFLFKLALSPYWSGGIVFDSPSAPGIGNDFDLIELTYAERVAALKFCEELWSGMMRAKGLGHLDPRKVLGNSYFETQPEEWIGSGTAYGKDSRIAQRFRVLAERDRSFKNYLDKRGIDPDQLDFLSANERAAEVRKISPLVTVREFYRGVDNIEGVARARSRKAPTLYAGAEAVFAITEGNPRWFIGLTERLLSRREPDDTVSEAIQAEEIFRASSRFAAMLRTLPVETRADFGTRRRGVLSALNAIGDWTHAQVVGGEFQPEPPGSFIVDTSLPTSVYDIVGKALNAGGIIFVPSDDPLRLLTALRGKRFRISYLLAPKYGLPLRLGREIALSRILQEQHYFPRAEQLPLTGT
jgi:hypothetical protein